MAGAIVAVADSPFPDLKLAEAELGHLDTDWRMAEEPTQDGILAVAADADALFVTYGRITAEVIGGLGNCKVIGRFGIGIDNIDIPAAKAAGITVVYAPVYCLDEVSDHAMAMLLSLARKVPYSNHLVQSGRWEMPAVVPISRLRGKTLGLVGFGNIPQLVAPKAQAFGLNVITSDPFIQEDVCKKAEVKLVELDELLAQSDYVSIHAPSTPQTEKMFNADTFKKMQNHALLINTARGPLIDADALCDALDAGEIGGAALDVLPVEPPSADSPLLGRNNLVLSPHTGFYSEEALLDLQTTVAKDVAAVLDGKEPKYPVNV